MSQLCPGHGGTALGRQSGSRDGCAWGGTLGMGAVGEHWGKLEGKGLVATLPQSAMGAKLF